MKTKLLVIALAVGALLCGCQKSHLQKSSPVALNKNAGSCFIVVSKQSMTLSVYDCRTRLLEEFPICCGTSYGDKRADGDKRTPQGVFSVEEIVNSTVWTHDFGDGKGDIKDAYGPWFIRLRTGFDGIGIHGTHDDKIIGNRASEGSICLNNADLKQLMPYVTVDMPVIITPSNVDAAADQNRTAIHRYNIKRKIAEK